MHVMIILLATLLTVSPNPQGRRSSSTKHVTVSQGVPDSVTWQIYFGHTLISRGDSLRVLAFTEQEFDDRAEGDTLQALIAERKQLTQYLADSLGHEVSIITVQLKTFATGSSCRLLDSYSYGIRRDSLEVKALGISLDTQVSPPWGSDFIFVIFPKMEFRNSKNGSDYFYIRFNGVDPFIRE